MSLRRFLAATVFVMLPGAFASAQTVTTLVNQPPPDGVVYGFLLTDGTVLYQGGAIFDWYKLTPDAYGSYQNGTWSSVASTPFGYAPYATGGGVLPDGRVLLTGGEYLLNNAGTALNFALTNKSALYDPVADTWTEIKPPPGWVAIGDSPGTLRADGLFMIGEKIFPRYAVFDPLTLSWAKMAVSGKADVNAEEGWTLMPDGSVLTEDVTDAPNSEIFTPGTDPLTGSWASAGSTVANLKFTWSGKNAQPIAYHGGLRHYKPAGEIGPAMLRPDGTVFATGAINKGASTAHTAIYTPGHPGTWAPGPDFAPGDDAGDEFAVLLPNGNVLVEANTDGADDVNARAKRIALLMQSHQPTLASVRTRAPGAAAPARSNPCAPNPLQTYHLYEFDGTTFALEPVDVTTCGDSLNLLVLPTGETIVGGVGLYTSATGDPAPNWAPTITGYPTTVAHGASYQIFGTQFTGLSKANEYGDEFPAPTNYPLVRITNDATGHVFYARTHDNSTSAVATGSLIVSTHFDVPRKIDRGGALLEVVTNGIASIPVHVTVD